MHIPSPSPRILILNIRKIQHPILMILININQTPNPISLLRKRTTSLKISGAVSTPLTRNMDLSFARPSARILDTNNIVAFRIEYGAKVVPV